MSQPQPPRLLDQVRQTLRLKHFSLKTEKSHLQIDLPYIDKIERAKRPEQLPVVFTRLEVKQILAQLDGINHLDFRITIW